MISLNVLFANDDVLTQWVMTEVLKGAGFDVVSACRGGQVVELLNGDADFDLLLTDLALPDTSDEHEIGRHWSRAFPGRPVIYTGSSRKQLRRPLQCNESFLRAPFSAGVLVHSIDHALEEARFQPRYHAPASMLQHVH